MNLAYVDFLETSKGYRAGILVTDETTKPLEFRVTTNVKIDELQKILYGESLESILYKERFTVELVNSLQENFDVLLTKEKSILSLREEIGKPILYIQKHDPFKAMDRYSHKVINLADKFQPLTITITPEDSKLLIPISRKLQEIYKNFNIMEPFNRIQKAIDYLSKS
jgi:hypothetical protein